jgi:hypothetical protein
VSGGRKFAAVLLYMFAAIGTLVSLALFAAILNGMHGANAAVGDLAGVAMTTTFLLLFPFPLTLIALLLAIWLAPPTRWFRSAGHSEQKPADAAAPLPDRPYLVLTVVFAGAGVGVLAALVAMLRDIMRVPPDSGGAIALAVACSPAVTLAVILFALAARWARRI